jgi:hypothetical protein
MKKRIFLSHATEDQDDIVRPLAEALSTDFDVWYSEYKLVLGMSLLQEISKGLSSCDYGVVVLSKNFFAKNWPLQELNGLFSLEEMDKKVILPIWHKINVDEVRKYSPILADRKAAKSGDGIVSIVRDIKGAMDYFDRGKYVQKKAGINNLRVVLKRDAERQRSNRIISSEAGVKIVMEIAVTTLGILEAQIKVLQNEGFPNLRINVPPSNNILCSANVYLGKIQLVAEYCNTCGNSAADARLDVALAEVQVNSWNEVGGRAPIERKKYSLFINQQDRRVWQEENGDRVYTPDELVDVWLQKMSDSIAQKKKPTVRSFAV